MKAPILLLLMLLCCSGTVHSYAEDYDSYSLEELTQKAEQGDMDAQYKLGIRYVKGRGAPKDFKKAFLFFKKAAEQGHAGGQNGLGFMYKNGQEVDQDYNEAIKWFKKSTSQGYANAQANLGFMYDRGEGVRKDKQEAVKWYRKAAEQGYANAQNNLGVMYYNGEGVEKDKQEAVKYYRKAAEQGDANAQNNVAWMYYIGEGVAQDKKEAAKWYGKATEQGNVNAQNALGHMYSEGEGVLQNEIMAYALYSLAAIEGDGNVITARNLIAKQLTKQEIKQGRKIAADLQKKIEQNQSSEIIVLNSKITTASEPKTTGSAFIITNNGYIITCYHVIKGASKIIISANNREYPAKLIRADKYNDIALLKIDGTFSAVSFAPRNSVKMGSDVFTIGYPNPILQGVNQKFTEGNINALTGYQDDIRLYQVSVPVQPGNSGGALLNDKGDVVGIIVAILKAETAFKVTGSLPQNVNYALKSTYAQILADSVPEAVDGLRKPHRKKSFNDVVDRVKNSMVLVLAYE